MQVGFTGTRKQLPEAQGERLYIVLHGLTRTLDLRVPVLHHGDCNGADAAAHRIALGVGYEVVIHPPDNPTHRANCEGAIKVHDPLPYLMRNRRIVDACEVLVACPGTMNEGTRSGTWSTVRYARKRGKPILIIFPNGRIE